MKIKPVFEKEADETTKSIYKSIREALDLPSVPLFFCYLGAFPDYLEYINDILIKNLKDPKLEELTFEQRRFINEVFQESFEKSDNTGNFLMKYQNNPEFIYLKKDLENLFKANSKMAILFIAIREAVKGFAVAAKKLPSPELQVDTRTKIPNKNKEEIILGDFINIAKTADYQKTETNDNNEETKIALFTKEITYESQTNIIRSLFPEYLRLCYLDILELQKKENFLYFRVGVEKILVQSVDNLSYPINSGVNVVLEITKKYPNFIELLYLLSEEFPTLIVQKLLLSGYMLF